MSEPDVAVIYKPNIERDKPEPSMDLDRLYQNIAVKLPVELIATIIRSCQHCTDAVHLLLVCRCRSCISGINELKVM
jgi:hypothetical protein